MSPNIGNFVHDLVEMARATEELPRVREELAKTEFLTKSQGDTIHRLESKSHDLELEIETLRANIRSLVCERDDASFRELEAQDKVLAWERLVGGFQSEVGSLKQAYEKMETTPIPLPLPVTSAIPDLNATESGATAEAKGESAFSPLPQAPSSLGALENPILHVTSSASPGVESSQATTPSPEDREPADPIATGTVANIESPPATVFCASPIDNAPLGDHGPYHGLFYRDLPVYISHDEWVAGEGSEENYWRRNKATA